MNKLFTILLLVFSYHISEAQRASGIPHLFSTLTGDTITFTAPVTSITFSTRPVAQQDEWDTLMAPVGFNFTFAGVIYSKVVLTSNGYIALVPGSYAGATPPPPFNTAPYF